MDRRDLFDHIRHTVRIFNNDLVRLLLTEVGELGQHLLRRMQVERRLPFIFVTVTGLYDASIDRILRIQEMNVARGDAHLMEFVGELHDLPVDLPQVIVRFDPVELIPDKITVVPDRLHFQIVVEIHDLCDHRRGFLEKDRRIQLSCRAGRAQDQSFPALHEKGSRNAGPLLKVFEV